MKKRETLLFVVGMVMICLLFVPWLILGQDAVITYHDQLDGEMIAYILQAKHLAVGKVLPEFMNGASKTALTLPAPASVLLFLGGNYEAALFVMQLMGSLAGYAGMFLLAKEVTGKFVPAWLAGCMYGALPFLPVYGFSQYGLPLLIWCMLQVRKGCKRGPALLYGLIFALNSSLALVGFAVLAAAAVWILTDIMRGKRKEWKMQLSMWLVLLTGYVVTNLSLIKQILGVGEDGISHKTEYALVAESFWDSFKNGFFYGGQHSQDYHFSFLIVGAVMILLSKVLFKGPALKILRGRALTVVLVNAVLAAIGALWNCEAGVMIRQNMGALGAFQVERFLWLSPCLWYLFLACCIAMVANMCCADTENNKAENTEPVKTSRRKILAYCACGCMVAALGISGVQILKNSDVKSNVKKLFDSDYPAISYADYYAIGVYEQVLEFMNRSTGLEQSEYRVVSLGIDPAAAMYHGFYCLDGYSNNYSLEYKHAFREIVAPALEKSDYLKDYYDNWGNRCYLFGTECPGYYTIEKNGFYFSHLELNTQALKALGGDYLFSAAYIANAEELGLSLLCEEPFETDESYYRIFVYKVNEGIDERTE